jgi:hypothetical protein
MNRVPAPTLFEPNCGRSLITANLPATLPWSARAIFPRPSVVQVVIENPVTVDGGAPCRTNGVHRRFVPYSFAVFELLCSAGRFPAPPTFTDGAIIPKLVSRSGKDGTSSPAARL